MRTAAEIQEKIEHLFSYKQELTLHFRVINLSRHKHAAISAFYRSVDNEIAMLQWALGELEQTWSDDLSEHIDMETFFDSLPPTEYPRLPNKQELVALK
jgi:hypothetical protein